MMNMFIKQTHMTLSMRSTVEKSYERSVTYCLMIPVRRKAADEELDEAVQHTVKNIIKLVRDMQCELSNVITE
ncbi:MAG: hypothetical protein ACKPKO_33465, partial [Candidatus Fonsibacter sp.]